MINILNSNEKLTPYIFYSRFLQDVVIGIQTDNDVHFKLFENGDDLIYDSNYTIEPITIPLLLSLIEQLSKYYKKPIDISLYDNSATKQVLNFLYKSDFFYVSGNNTNPTFPLGRNILKFDLFYLGNFIKKETRPEHKVRCYSLDDANLRNQIDRFENDDNKRDFLISEFVYIVRVHFQVLLYDNHNTQTNVDFYVEVLSELITNGVLHSKSNTFALMFVNRYSTKFSISDNGIGLTESIKNKQASALYNPLELKELIDNIKSLKVDKRILDNLNFIIETLYFSSLKDRRGLFDLMLSVVCDSNGYFRLHSENVQIIISSRMINELITLRELRSSLYHLHRNALINGIQSESVGEMVRIKNEIKKNFVILYEKICDRYNQDHRYSSLRFFQIKFRGVHIEVEIPKF